MKKSIKRLDERISLNIICVVFLLYAVTLAFPFFGDAEPLAISGTLTLPEAMNYSVRALGPRATAKNVPVITAGAGVEGGETVFSRLGSARPSVLTLSAVEDALKFSFEASGAAIKVR